MEQEGTYKLPEAQLDRFMIRLALGYPDRADEVAVIGGKSSRQLEAVCKAQDIISAREEISRLVPGEAVCGYIADIAAATRRHGGVKLGLSTRGAAALGRMACALAAVSGRDYAMPQDVIEAAPYVIKHRLICRGGGAGSAEDILRQVLDSVPVPTEG